jgi:hypothetical protein
VSRDDFPQRPEQHVSQDTSIRVFQECLPEKWIFRDQGIRNDYGLDGEVELVTETGSLRGKVAKVQLKGRAQVTFNEDRVAAVGGIKQSILRYWLALSRYTNVIVVVTDNAARESYFTPVFWEATLRLDGSDETRSLHFQQPWSLRTPQGPGLFELSVIERPWNVIRAHEELLRALPRMFHDFLWVFQADPWMPNGRPEVVERWLRYGRQLLDVGVAANVEPLFDFAYWRDESQNQWGDSPMYGTLRSTYLKTFPLVFQEMRRISELVLRGQYFWSREAFDYFELVRETPVPTAFDYDSVERFVSENRIDDPS